MPHHYMINRRQTIKGIGAALGAVALRGYQVHASAPVYFSHGIASGDPLTDRVILWTRVLPGDGVARTLRLRWEVAEDLSFLHPVASGSANTSEQRDYTVKVDVTGLMAGRRYFYRFVCEGVLSPVGRTLTLPKGEVDRFSIALCSCSNYPQGYFHAYRDIARSNVDLVMHVGDYIYEYEAGKYANPVATETLQRQVAPSHELVALEDYRMRYGLYRTDPDLQAAHAAHPWICVWDDHELCNDTWREGAENHQPEDGAFAQRIAMARRAYHEWLPIRTASQSDQSPIYRSFPVGNLADLIMLDTRLHGRDRQLSYFADLQQATDPLDFRDRVLAAEERTILGADQEAWLANQLAASADRGAIWQVLGQQVLMGKLRIPQLPADAFRGVQLSERSARYVQAMQQLAPLGMPMNLDAWDGYPACRERVQRQLLTLAANPVVLAGDTHNAWAFNLRNVENQAVGVEIGTPGVSSPGLETYLPIDASALRQALIDSSEELVDADTSRRGWSEISLTPETLTSQWRFVSSVLEREYRVTEGAIHTCRAGERRFT